MEHHKEHEDLGIMNESLKILFRKLQVTVNQDNPFTFGNGTDSKVGTRVVSIDLSNPCTGQKALVQNTTKPIVVEMDGTFK